MQHRLRAGLAPALVRHSRTLGASLRLTDGLIVILVVFEWSAPSRLAESDFSLLGYSWLSLSRANEPDPCSPDLQTRSA